MSPGCSERERVSGAITTRCERATAPIWIGENSLDIKISLYVRIWTKENSAQHESGRVGSMSRAGVAVAAQAVGQIGVGREEAAESHEVGVATPQDGLGAQPVEAASGNDSSLV